MSQSIVTPFTVLFVFCIVGSLTFLIPLMFEKRSTVQKILSSPIDTKELKFEYTLTYFASTQLYNLAQRIDLFMLSFFGLKQDVGYYALAQKITLTITTLVISVTQVLSPLFAKARTKKDIDKLMNPGLMYLSIPAAMFVILYFIPESLFRILFTDSFITASRIAKGLAFPFIIFTYSNFLLIFMLYTVRKPKYILFSNVLFFAGMSIGCYYLIPQLGVFAPAWALSGSIGVSAIVLGSASIYEYKKLPN